MGFIFKFSYANLLRKLNRTMFVMILIAIGVAGMMFMEGFYAGLLDTMKENVIRSGTGHIIIGYSSLFVLVLNLLSVVYPALKVIRKRPIDAIHDA